VKGGDNKGLALGKFGDLPQGQRDIPHAEVDVVLLGADTADRWENGKLGASPSLRSKLIRIMGLPMPCYECPELYL